MSEIVERLRNWRRWNKARQQYDPDPIKLDAAARIEQLEAVYEAAKELLRAVNQTHDHTQWFSSIGELASTIARAALPAQEK